VKLIGIFTCWSVISQVPEDSNVWTLFAQARESEEKIKKPSIPDCQTDWGHQIPDSWYSKQTHGALTPPYPSPKPFCGPRYRLLAYSDSEPHEPVLSVQQLLQLATPSSRSKFSTDWVTNQPRDVVRDVHPIPSSPVNPNPHLNFPPSNPVSSPSSVDLQASHQSTRTTSLQAVVYLRNVPKHISVDEVQSKLSSKGIELDGCSITQPLLDSNLSTVQALIWGNWVGWM